jgi:hypothetical protein
MATKWQKINIWRRGVCKNVDVRYRNSSPRVECYSDPPEQRRDKAAELELSANNREVAKWK